MKNCPNCNGLLNENDSVCPTCGLLVNANISQPQMGQAMMGTNNYNELNANNYSVQDKTKNFFEFPQEPVQTKKEEKVKIKMNNKFIKPIVIVLVCLAVIGLGIFVGSKIFKDKEQKVLRDNITSEEVIEIIEKNELSKYDITDEVNENKSQVYTIFPKDQSYQIYYSYFDNIESSNKNFSANLEMIKSNNDDLTQIRSESSITKSVYSGTTGSKYVQLLQIGKSYFQVEVDKSNKNNVEKIMKNFE